MPNDNLCIVYRVSLPGKWFWRKHDVQYDSEAETHSSARKLQNLYGKAIVLTEAQYKAHGEPKTFEATGYPEEEKL